MAFLFSADLCVFDHFRPMARRNYVIVHQILALSIEDILEEFRRQDIRTW